MRVGRVHEQVRISSCADKTTRIVESFSTTWKQSIATINKEVMQTFANYKIGTEIVQVRKLVRVRAAAQTLCR
jgi:hypothetical protein